MKHDDDGATVECARCGMVEYFKHADDHWYWELKRVGKHKRIVAQRWLCPSCEELEGAA